MADVWQEPVITEWQKDMIRGLFGDLRPGVGPLTDVGVPPGLSGLETASLAGLEGLSAEALAGAGGMGVQRQGMQALSDIFTQGPSDFEDLFRSTVRDPMMESFREDVEPALRRTYAGRGRGSEAQAARGKREEALLEGLTRARGEMGMGLREQQLTGLGMLPEVAGGEIEMFRNLLEAGQVPRDVEMEKFLAAERGQERALQQRQQDISAMVRLAGIPQFENIVEFHPGERGSSGKYQGWANTGVNIGLMVAALMA